MLVLLPPSEGKTAPDPGLPAARLDALVSPALVPYREKVLDALAEVSARPDALDVLGAGASLRAEVAANTALRGAPAAPASEVYTGVLFAAAGLADLPPAAAARATDDVLIASALWGVVRPVDPIPAYRLSMKTDLPGVGPLARFWRGALAEPLDARAAGDVVVDCRSGGYVAAWRPAPGVDWLAVQVLREVDGHRSVVSHHAKHTRGVLTRHLLTRPGALPRTSEDVAHASAELIGESLLAVELGEPTSKGARTLSLIVA